MCTFTKKKTIVRFNIAHSWQVNKMHLPSRMAERWYTSYKLLHRLQIRHVHIHCTWVLTISCLPFHVLRTYTGICVFITCVKPLFGLLPDVERTDRTGDFDKHNLVSPELVLYLPLCWQFARAHTTREFNSRVQFIYYDAPLVCRVWSARVPTDFGSLIWNRVDQSKYVECVIKFPTFA